MAMRCLLLLAASLVAGSCRHHGEARPLVPAVMLFGDSLLDTGNNDYIDTVAKANFPPYGRDFEDHIATGRFCNGKILSDFIGEILGFTSSPYAYLSPDASGENLLSGANFASAASGYYDQTAHMYNVIPLSQQLEYFKEYQHKLEVLAGSSQAQSIISDSLYIISAGSNDYLFNYYIKPFIYKSPDQFSDLLIGIFNNTVAELYGMGARRIGVFSLPSFGCAPLTITVFGHGGNDTCVTRLNNDAQRFNRKLSTSVDVMSNWYHDLKIVVLDLYTPLHSLVTSPRSQGFTEARRGCCGTGTVEATVFLCNPISIGTCPNATVYVFWDSIHPTEAANKLIADSLIDGINLLVM
ncbi:GDSL esterase/lipase APG-like [Hordeum vulgare subsp. vulgare]|uniref:GDSL esterase/lipase n=1 Tax=Hordeum vulgare subsp. vulgare TaxID=112509 RepID=A0A8I6Z190_HORVV|nr:GDSL esterase/lipase APG-like [Hordeum vulgare subsp. vulgare]KAI4973935.1 hypothetical protein ZWY2020_041716 [Hordeum vulgare]